MQIVSDLILAAVVIVAAITDLRSGRILNWLVYPAMLLGLALGAVDGAYLGGSEGALDGLKNHALGAGAAFGVLFFCFAIGGMNAGDVKLMVAVGALGGWSRPGEGWFIAYVIFYAFAIGATLGILAAMWRRCLGLAAIRTWWGLRMLAVQGTSLDEAVPFATIRVPLGFSTCLATLWLLAENAAGTTLGSLLARIM